MWALQVAPSFFDAPGAQGSSTGLPSATSAMPAPAPVPAPQLSDDQLPNITFAFASQVGYKVRPPDISHTCSMHIANATNKKALQIC